MDVPQQQWEYKIEEHGMKLASRVMTSLNKAGGDGWEVVAVAPSPSSLLPAIWVFYKRLRTVVEQQEREGVVVEKEDTEAEEAIAMQSPEGFLCNRCRFRVLPIHKRCPGCGRPRDDIKPVLD